MLDATDNVLTLSAFDYDVSARAMVSADVAEPGRVLLPGRILADIVKSLPHRPVELSLTGTEVVLTCGSAEFGLLTMPVEDYPKLPEPPVASGTVDAAVLREAINQVAVAASKDDTLPMLACVRVDVDGETVTLAATDRYRMAARALAWSPASPDVKAGVMIYGRVLHDIARSLSTGPVTVGLDDKMASFEIAGRTTTARLIDEQFIDYEARLGTDYPLAAMVDVGPLAEAVKRVALVADRNVPVRLEFTPGSVLVKAGGGDTGRGAEILPVDYDGDPIEIAFNHLYLGDALGGISTPRALMRMTAPAKPALLTGEGEPDYRHLVMAIRMQ